MKDGKPVDIAANIVFPFRVKDDQGKVAGREIPGPAVSELAIYPADASGKKTLAGGLPDPQRSRSARYASRPRSTCRRWSRRGRSTVRVEAVSPRGAEVAVFEDTRSIAAKATSLPVPFSFPIGAGWEDGVWMLRFQVDKAERRDGPVLARAQSGPVRLRGGVEAGSEDELSAFGCQLSARRFLGLRADG